MQLAYPFYVELLVSCGQVDSVKANPQSHSERLFIQFTLIPSSGRPIHLLQPFIKKEIQ